MFSCKASNVCSQCKAVWYCGRGHQKAHWKAHKKHCANKTVDTAATATLLDAAQQDFLFPEYDIVVEPEDMADEQWLSQQQSNGSDGNGKKVEIWEDAHTPGGPDEEQDAKLTQRHYNKALSEQLYDPIYVQFLTRIERSGKKQILRYSETSIHHQTKPASSTAKELPLEVRDRGRLYLTKEMKLEQTTSSTNNIPDCPHCGAPRAFEFQV